jgi:hypothetical protein
MLKQKVLLGISIAFAFFYSCISYQAGNLHLLGYTIDTKLSYYIRKQYLDSITNSDEFRVPQKWKQFNKLIDINPESTWRVYFKSNPEEMYLITINTNFVLEDVYNPSINDFDYVAYPEKMPKKEKARILKRAKEEILDRIEKMARRDGCPDSILYFQSKYINEKWTTPPKWPN